MQLQSATFASDAPGNVGHVIQIALRIGMFEIDRRMNRALAQAQDRRREPRGAASALGMADHRFG